MPDSTVLAISAANDKNKLYLDMQIKFNSLRCNLYDTLTGQIIV